MLGHNQRTHADKHDQGRDDDAVLIRRKQFLAVGKLVDQSVGDKDGIVVALTEDECRQNHIDDVELHVAERHDTQDPYPAYGHRQECQQTQFQAPERQPQEDEYDESAGKTDIVEVVGKFTGHRPVHPDKVKRVAMRAHLLIQGRLQGHHVLAIGIDDVDNGTIACIRGE